MQYCEPSFSWNLRGWAKAAVMWSFVLSAALGLQKLAIQVCLDGLLPGMFCDLSYCNVAGDLDNFLALRGFLVPVI